MAYVYKYSLTMAMYSVWLRHLIGHVLWVNIVLSLCIWFLLGSETTAEPIDKTPSDPQRVNTAGKVLLFPYGHGYSSHIMDFQRMAKVLTHNGYRVSVLINDEDRKYMDEIDGVRMRVHSYPCCSTTDERLRLTDSDFRELILTQTNTSVIDFIILLSEQQINLCEQLLQSRTVLEEIENEEYDLMIVDFADSCSRVITQYFDIPLVVYSATGLSFDAAFFPNLPTIVPTFTTNFLDEMTFSERTENMVRLLLVRLLSDPYYFNAFNDLKHKYGMSESLPTVRKAFAGQMVLAHTSWALDFPRPLLPTVVSIGGMHVDEPKPLSNEISDFIKKSGKNGLIVVAFGSLIDKMDAKMAEVIATALAQLDYGVIWRYTGEPPKSLSENTLTLNWIPQNDLLAHPLTKVFITHCGIHSTYEAVHHSVPVVAVPLCADEFENANKLVRRAKMGVLLDLKSLSSVSLVSAVKEVLTNTSYKENAVSMSKLLFDRPVSARDTFLFYVDYVIRHKGPGPLGSNPVINLDTAELFGVDVVLFLMTIAFTIFAILLIVFTMIIRYCLRLCKYYLRLKQKCE